MIVYLNGAYVRAEEATVSVDDRGFLFADGVYEVVRLYDGVWFEAEAHYARLRESLEKIRILFPDIEALSAIAHRLLEENEVPSTGTRLYVQVTRGVAPRTHAFPPAETSPTVYANVAPLTTYPEEIELGMGAVTLGDQRWGRCDIKSTALLPNVLAHQQALDSGAHEAIFIRDGMVTEATHNSVMGVIDGVVRTAPLSNLILPSVSRRVVLEICEELGIPVAEFPMGETELRAADELFVTGTACEVTPVVTLDGRPVADGTPGDVTRRIRAEFLKRTVRSG